MGNAAQWAGSAGDKFREAARQTEDPAAKLLADGLAYLADSIRDLDAQLATIQDGLDR